MKKLNLNKNLVKKINPYFYILPAISIICFIYLYALVKLFQNSFLNLATPQRNFIGFKNYINVLKDTIFWEAFSHNLIIMAIAVPILIFLSIIFSVFLYEKIRGWKAYRFVIFLPYILSITVTGIAFSYIFTYNGILNSILRLLKMNFFALDWLGSSNIAIFTVIFVIIWKELGFGVILFYSRLMSVPIEIYDAAKVDGVTWWKNLIYITIPQLRTVIQFYLILLIITMFSWIFNYIYVMTNGGPGTSTNVVEFYIYKRAFFYNVMNSANAASVILFIIVIVFIFIQFKIRIRIGGGSE
jgi:ABC-type sugar transport system permease subunit